MANKERFYKRHLQRYFDKHYGEYDETVEWFVDSAQNKWRFVVPELGVVVTLVCGANGDVCETIRKRQSPNTYLYFDSKE